jgi:hypothetical protein
MRAFIATGSAVLPSTVVYDWTNVRQRRMTGNLRWSVIRVLRKIAVPMGRADTIGRPILWRLRNGDSE